MSVFFPLRARRAAMIAVVCSALSATSCWLALGFQDRTQAATGGSGGGAATGSGSSGGGGSTVVCSGGLRFGTPQDYPKQTNPTAVTVDPGHLDVYWANSDPCNGSTLMKLAKVDGGLPPSAIPSVVVGNLGPTVLGPVVALAIEGQTLWACQQKPAGGVTAPDGGPCPFYSSIFEIPLLTRAPTSVAQGDSRYFQGLAIAGSLVAYGDQSDDRGAIFVLDGTTGMPVAGGNPQQGDAGTIKAIAAAGAPPMFYWQASGQIWAASPGGMPACVAAATDASSMAASHGWLYWTNSNEGTVNKVSTSASCVESPTVIAMGQGFPSAITQGIAVDSAGTNVFWSSNIDNVGMVLTVPAASSSPVPHPQTVYTADGTGQPTSVATDDSFVYATIAGDDKIVAVPISCN